MIGTALVLAACLAATPTAPATPRTALGWTLGERAAPGTWATFATETRASGFEQQTRATFVALGPAKGKGQKGVWLEIQEELAVPGQPPGASAPALVTRVLLAPDGRILRTVTQRPGGKPAERAVGPGMAVAVGALAPFDGLGEGLAVTRERVAVEGLGEVDAVVRGSPGRMPVTLWHRASDGLLLQLRQTGGGAEIAWRLVATGTGGKSRIAGK